ncbi:hypothetical protein [Salinicoccus albus]|uniref:hypothetical protein n=1 Tax=Salinicoccus albus TaxID=418756 RepID=UPI00037FF4BD|nr:hypothetical protein [Salinicoccus albus]
MNNGSETDTRRLHISNQRTTDKVLYTNRFYIKGYEAAVLYKSTDKEGVIS